MIWNNFINVKPLLWRCNCYISKKMKKMLLLEKLERMAKYCRRSKLLPSNFETDDYLQMQKLLLDLKLFEKQHYVMFQSLDGRIPL